MISWWLSRHPIYNIKMHQPSVPYTKPLHPFQILEKKETMKFLLLTLFAGAAVAVPAAKPQAAPIGCSTCDPNPGKNLCDASTSCTSIWGHTGPSPWPYYCACAAGYKAWPLQVGADPAAQWRLPWATQEGRVFVRPGVVCNATCTSGVGANGCQEIPVYPNCL